MACEAVQGVLAEESSLLLGLQRQRFPSALLTSRHLTAVSGEGEVTRGSCPSFSTGPCWRRAVLVPGVQEGPQALTSTHTVCSSPKADQLPPWGPNPDTSQSISPPLLMVFTLQPWEDHHQFPPAQAVSVCLPVLFFLPLNISALQSHLMRMTWRKMWTRSRQR